MEKLKELPGESIDTVVTSPPYWGLRDYGAEGQWGLEPDFHDYLKKMIEWMREIRRVLKPTGTAFVNLGDTYAGGVAHSDWSGCDDRFNKKRDESSQFKSIEKNHIKNKSRYGIPERFYTMCIDDGWIARNHIPWVKENAMPASVRDRFQNKWESIFFFAKESQYYFNLDNVRVQPKTVSKPFNVRVREAIAGRGVAKLGEFGFKCADWEKEAYDKTGTRKESNVLGQSTQGIHRNREEGLPDWDETKSTKKQDNTLKADGRPDPTKKGFNDRWKYREVPGEPSSQASIKERIAYARRVEGKDHDSCLNNPKGKNPGDVLHINVKPFIEAHFATFPIDLPLFFLRCACPPDGMVLDPFFGAGTTAVAAEMLGLNWCGIELKEEYVSDIVKKRLYKFKNHRMDSFVG